MQERGAGDASAAAVLPIGARLLHPAEQLFAAMLDGFEIQQRSRFLAEATIHGRRLFVERFARWTNEYPWRWGPQDVEEWTSAARSERNAAFSTVRGQHLILSLFCGYICDQRYGWAQRCEELFGTHPVQVCHDWNTVRHRADFEAQPGRRRLSRQERRELRSFRVPARPAYGATSTVMWPTERDSRVGSDYVSGMFARLRDELGMARELGPHCLRHSDVTHLIEDGWDPLFVQQQVGHAWASTTAIYTGVSSDYKTEVVRRALDGKLNNRMASGDREER